VCVSGDISICPRFKSQRLTKMNLGRTLASQFDMMPSLCDEAIIPVKKSIEKSTVHTYENLNIILFIL